jgi:hypothetical protein
MPNQLILEAGEETLFTVAMKVMSATQSLSTWMKVKRASSGRVALNVPYPSLSEQSS